MSRSPDSNELAQLGLSTQEKRHERVKAFRRNPTSAAVVNKLVRENQGLYDRDTRAKDQLNVGGYLRRTSDETAANVTDSSNLYQLLPDTELAEQILVSSILAPKDMVNVELNFNVNSPKIPLEISGPMLGIVEEFFTKTYKIPSLLPKILSDALFKRGSYPMLILPESSIDEIINSSGQVGLEDLSNNDPFKLSVGILGNALDSVGQAIPRRKTNVSMESARDILSTRVGTYNPSVNAKGKDKNRVDLKVLVSDNPDVLKAPFLYSRVRSQAVSNRLGLSMESRAELSRSDIEASFYKPRQYQSREVVGLKTAAQVGRPTVGHPLVMRLPSESIIPVHVPGSPEEHVGYFVLLDATGNPLNKANKADYYNDLGHNLQANRELASQLIAQSTRAVEGWRDGTVDTAVDEATRMYATVVENDLISRLKNGLYNDTVEIARPLEVYRIMLARTFANMTTQLLYVPVELVSYIAFDYNQYGVGQSLLENNKILASLRVSMMLANTMSAIDNSVAHTGLNITLDPDDPDPSTTVEKLVHNYVNTRRASYPLGASSPVDIINFLQNAGVDIHVSGNPAYPETRMEVEDRGRSIVEPNNELEESLKKRYLMSLGLSPETVDNSYNVEFATSIVSSNLLLTKRVVLYQDMFTEMLSDFFRKYISQSGALRDALLKCIASAQQSAAEQEAKEKEGQSPAEEKAQASNQGPELQTDGKEQNEQHLEWYREFVMALSVSLPRPDNITIERQLEAYDKYVEALEKVVDAYINSEFLDGTALGEQADQVDVIKSAILAYFKRKWLNENNVMPELLDLVTFKDEKHPMLDLLEVHNDHITAIGASIQGYMVKVAEAQTKRDELSRAIEADKGIKLGSGDEYGSNSSSDDDSESSDDDFGDDDDFGGMDDDMSGEDEELDAEPEAEAEPEGEEAEEESDADLESTGGVAGDGVIIQPE